MTQATADRVYQQRLGLDLAECNGPGRYVLPVPATFVIDRGGVIRARFADVDYRQRMESISVCLTPADSTPRHANWQCDRSA